MCTDVPWSDDVRRGGGSPLRELTRVSRIELTRVSRIELTRVSRIELTRVSRIG
jgi:hypothetical protein